MQRKSSRNLYFVRRIPSDVRQAATGLKLAIPVGELTQLVIITAKTQAIRLSLRSGDPAEVKTRQAAVDAYLENVWRALRADAPLDLSHKQVTALAGEFYRAWSAGEGRERTVAIEQSPGGGWQRVGNPHVAAEEWEAVLEHWHKLEAAGDAQVLEKALGAVVNRLLLRRGIARVTPATREMLLTAFWQAARDAFENRKRNAEGDYSDDLKALRFPDWTSTTSATPSVSLKALVEAWWVEARATGRKPSTHESYRNTVSAFTDYLGHDDAGRVTRTDVVGFKNHRLAALNPRTGKPISAKTVKDSDLSGLKTIFGWAVVNGKMPSNPAEGVTIKLGKPRRLRSKGFSDGEAAAILKAAHTLKQGGERLKTFAAKRWVPWLCAYTGARVGEVAQLRKEDVRREGRHWVITITPEAGTVKTNEARDVVLHPHLAKLGFVEFVSAAAPGHLFLEPSPSRDVRGPLRGLKNRLAEFARSVVPDRNVAPNHGWRHRFKTVGMEAGIAPRILDAIQGQSPRTVGDTYGDVTIRTQAAALAKIPRYSGG